MRWRSWPRRRTRRRLRPEPRPLCKRLSNLIFHRGGCGMPAQNTTLNTTPDTKLSPALQRALDLLDGSALEDGAGPAKNTGAIQAVWSSPIGSMLYDNAQAISRKFLSVWQHPVEWLNIPPGGIVLDVGSGPGSVTASLARAAG